MGDNGQQTAPRAAICYSGRRKEGGDGLAMAEGRNADPSSARAAGSPGTEAEELQQHCLSWTGCRGKGGTAEGTEGWTEPPDTQKHAQVTEQGMNERLQPAEIRPENRRLKLGKEQKRQGGINASEMRGGQRQGRDANGG